MSDYDLVIVGGGPAGLTAGLYAARANMNAVLFEQKGLGGELLNTDAIEDYPGFASITGAELTEKMSEHATKFGLRIVIKGVKQIRVEGDRKIIEMADGETHTALAVIVTVGGEPIKLGVVGEAEFHGRGVSYCAVCDGAFFKGADLAVIGGGDSAFQEGLFLTRFAKKLYVVHRRDEFRAQAILQDRLLGMDKVRSITPATVKEIGGDADVKWLDVIRDGKVERVPVEGVFVFIGFKPVGRYLFADHIEHDENGYLITDANMRTSIPGVYAAGDTRAQLAKQITTAVGDATTALLHAERYIEELKHAEKTFPHTPKEVIAEATSKVEMKSYLPGETVVHQGEIAESFYVIARGQAEITQTVDGRDVVVNTLGPGEYFGEIGLLTEAPRNATVKAKGPLEVMVFDQESFRHIVESSKVTAAEMTRVAAERMRKNRERVTSS